MNQPESIHTITERLTAHEPVVVQINAVYPGGSTGGICEAVSARLRSAGVRNYVLYADGPTSSDPCAIRYMTRGEIRMATVTSRLCGNYGFEASAATRRLIKTLDRLHPTAVHLHNLHGHNADLSLLLPYLKRRHMPLYWTFHDTWMLTGSCPHFDGIGCEKWRTGCGNCPIFHRMSWFFDRTAENLARKRRLSEGLDLRIIAPSDWMADLVRQSYLSEYPVTVIRNGIDRSVFRPTDGDIRSRYGLSGKRILLAVASIWTREKGYDTLLGLADRLSARPDRDNYRLVLVGAIPASSTKHPFPANVTWIPPVADRTLLAQLYTASDVLVNPTREETYPTVNLESIACGTPVVTYTTGGAPETVPAGCGVIVPKGDAEALLSEALRVAAHRADYTSACLAAAPAFDRDSCFDAYLSLYLPE